MFENRRFWPCALRSIALPTLALLLTLTLSGFLAAPAAAQVVDGVATISAADTGATTTGDGDENIDEWENDILNGTNPSTQAGVVDRLVSYLLRSLGLEAEDVGVPGPSVR